MYREWPDAWWQDEAVLADATPDVLAMMKSAKVRYIQENGDPMRPGRRTPVDSLRSDANDAVRGSANDPSNRAPRRAPTDRTAAREAQLGTTPLSGDSNALQAFATCFYDRVLSTKLALFSLFDL